MKKTVLGLIVYSVMSYGMQMAQKGEYVVCWGNRGEPKELEVAWVEKPTPMYPFRAVERTAQEKKQRGTIICSLTKEELENRGFKLNGSKIELSS